MSESAPVVLQSKSSEMRIDLARGATITFLGRKGRNLLATFDASQSKEERLHGDPDTAWLSQYSGGWQEMFPNAGAACLADGVDHPTHGAASLNAWRLTSHSGRRATMDYSTTAGLVIERHVEISDDGDRFLIQSSIRNVGDRRVPYLWGHHPAFSADPGDRVNVPAADLHAANPQPDQSDLQPGATGRWPNIPGLEDTSIGLQQIPQQVTERVCFLSDLARPEFRLNRMALGLSIHLSWSVGAFPYAWYWLNRGANRYPFHGRVSLVALEPVNTWPADGLAAAIQDGRARWLMPGAQDEGEVVVKVEDGIYPD